MIFNLAYPQQEGIDVYFKDDWERTQKINKKLDRDGYTIQPFPVHKVNEFMVSKRYFLGAASAWMSAQKWEDNVSYVRPRTDVRRFTREEVGLFLPFAQDVTIPHYYLDTVDKIDNLRRLKLELNERAFEDIEEKDAWEDELEADDLQGLPVLSDLSSLRGLKEFSIVSSNCLYANTPAKQRTFDDNVKVLEAIVKPRVMTPKPALAVTNDVSTDHDDDSTSSCVSLYRTSQVCFTCSQLIQPKPKSPKWASKSIREANARKRKAREERVLNGPEILGDDDIPDREDEIRDLVRAQPEKIVDYLFQAKMKRLERWDNP